MLNVMRATVAVSMTIFATFAGFAVNEPVIGLIVLFCAIAFLKADWSRR
jgi:hypothetical protein